MTAASRNAPSNPALNTPESRQDNSLSRARLRQHSAELVQTVETKHVRAFQVSHRHRATRLTTSLAVANDLISPAHAPRIELGDEAAAGDLKSSALCLSPRLDMSLTFPAIWTSPSSQVSNTSDFTLPRQSKTRAHHLPSLSLPSGKAQHRPASSALARRRRGFGEHRSGAYCL